MLNALQPSSNLWNSGEKTVCIVLVIFIIVAYLGISLFNWSFEPNLFKLTNQYA